MKGHMMENMPDERWITMVPGIRRQTIASGAHMMQMRVRLDAGSHLPEHQHPHEQITYVVSGRLRMLVAGVAHEIGPGDSLYLDSDVRHAVDVLEDALVVDTFSPPREDLLAQDRAES
jgi:quercetin dioxygenase-like cupin family protein